MKDKDKILKDFRERFVSVHHEYGEAWTERKDFEFFAAGGKPSELKEFFSTLVDQVREVARECPRHKQQLRCLGCLEELRANPYDDFDYPHAFGCEKFDDGKCDCAYEEPKP